MSSSCFSPGLRMLYPTQPSTGTKAPKMRMRASMPAVCMSSVAALACSGMPRRPAAERPMPAATPFFLEFFTFMSSSCFSPGLRMLYPTQPSTGTKAPKMRMRASMPAVCMSSVAASAWSGIPARAAAESPRPRGTPFFFLWFFSCMSLNWFSPG